MQNKSSAVTDRTIDQIGQRILTVFATMLSRIWSPERGVWRTPAPRRSRPHICAFNCGLLSNGPLYSPMWRAMEVVCCF